jgi:hypothetical protein
VTAAPPTDSFGVRRMFNGKLASIHKGMDFRADGNAGACGQQRRGGAGAPLYYEGNCVVIDHGLGLFTLSMHLSRIDVHEGQHVHRAIAWPERRHGPRDRAASALGGALAGTRISTRRKLLRTGFEQCASGRRFFFDRLRLAA